MLKPKKGNVVFVIICLAVALMIVLGFVLKSTTSRIYSTKKIGNTLYARELANSLASLSVKYLKQQLLDDGSEIVNMLSLPLKDFKDSGEKNLLPDIESITKSDNESKILDLIIAKSNLKDLKIEKLYWKVKPKDFCPISSGDNKDKPYPYSREKYGILHIYMTFSYISHVRNSKNDRNKESYHFVSDVSVVANLIPVLSRFSLYVEDALDGDTEDLERFNLIDVNSDGVFNKMDYMPWILKNHDREEGINTELKSFKSVLDSSRGLVFLGGAESIYKSIKLGLTFGEPKARNPIGEGLHFFCNLSDEKTGTGYFKNQESKEDFSAWGENVGLFSGNLGLCNDKIEDELPSDEDGEEDSAEEGDFPNDYYIYSSGSDEAIRASQEERFGSIFKLYGTDLAPSPTIVLGYVDSKYASVKFLKCEDSEWFLSNYDSESDFLLASSFIYDDIDDVDEDDECIDEHLTEFAFQYRYVHSKKLDYKEYLKFFASGYESDNYNRGYPSALNPSEEYPFKNKVVEGDDFVKLFKKQENSIFTDIPYNYKEIYSDLKLNELSKFLDLDKLNINNLENSKNNTRISYYLNLTLEDDPENKSIDTFHPKEEIEKDFLKYLKAKGILLPNNQLDFNGWLFIKNETDNDLVIDLNKIKLVSHGGIILSNGNLRIKSDIISESNNKKNLLTFITLGPNKDIIIDENVNRLDASLICKEGQVKVEGKGKGIITLDINGNVIMKKIHGGEDGLKYMRRGLKLNYNIDLSAKPFKNTDEEKNILMFNLNDKPKMINND